jgi:hypothetical protein
MPDTFYFLLFEFSECAYCFADEVVGQLLGYIMVNTNLWWFVATMEGYGYN